MIDRPSIKSKKKHLTWMHNIKKDEPQAAKKIINTYNGRQWYWRSWWKRGTVSDDFSGNKKLLKNVRANINISMLIVTSTGPSRKRMKSDWPPPEALFKQSELRENVGVRGLDFFPRPSLLHLLWHAAQMWFSMTPVKWGACSYASPATVWLLDVSFNVEFSLRFKVDS